MTGDHRRKVKIFPGGIGCTMHVHGEVNGEESRVMTVVEENVLPKLLVPIILFIDGTQIDVLGRHNMEPIFFTLGIFNCETRRQSEAWRCLGFVKETENKTNQIFLNSHNLDPSEKNLPSFGKTTNSFPKQGDNGYVPMKTRDYHAIISCILEDVVEATNNDDGYQCQLNINKKTVPMEHLLIFRIGFVIGDIIAHDKLVCLKKGANTGNNICRICNIPFNETDNEYHLPNYTNMKDLIKLMKKKNIPNWKTLDTGHCLTMLF